MEEALWASLWVSEVNGGVGSSKDLFFNQFLGTVLEKKSVKDMAAGLNRLGGNNISLFFHMKMTCFSPA